MSDEHMLGPNFFVVGAAKAGTTALHRYLGAHPDIYMSPVKEPSYFARELGASTAYTQSLDAYLALFRAGQRSAVRGESSPAYLVDPEAAARIREFCDEARILILLRNPLEAIVAVHGEARKFGLEPKRSVAAALAASDRGRPKLVARNGGFWTQYRLIVQYADQVERYRGAFPARQIHIGLYDDLSADTSAFYGEVLDFLEVDPSFRPTFARFNPYRGDVRSYLVQRLIMRHATSPETDGRGVARFKRLRSRVAKWNLVQRPRPAFEPRLHAELVAALKPDIERLAGLIDRDLSAWLTEPGVAPLGEPGPSDSKPIDPGR